MEGQPFRWGPGRRGDGLGGPIEGDVTPMTDERADDRAYPGEDDPAGDAEECRLFSCR